MKTTKQAIADSFTRGSILTAPANNEALIFKIGDKVIFTNDYGVKFNSVILGFSPCNDSLYKYGNRYHLDNDCWWFPVKESELKAIS